MLLLAALRETPAHRSTAAKYTSLNGLLYLASGGLLIAWPGVVQTVLRDAPFQGHEAALVRVLGMALAVIGWLYFFGGRSGGRQVVAASVLDRLILVPLVLVPTALAGVFPHTMIGFAILDPVLALVAWWLLARETGPRQGGTFPG